MELCLTLHAEKWEKDIGKQLAERSGKYLLDAVQEKLKFHFEDTAEYSINIEVKLVFTKGVIYPVIKNCIFFHFKNNTIRHKKCAKYTEQTKKLISSENITKFTHILEGCVKNVIETKFQTTRSKPWGRF